MSVTSTSACLCNSQLNYGDCCQPYHLDIKTPATPEQLMRSRFSAYALKNASYVFKTYAKEKQAQNPVNEIADFANSCRFVNLVVRDTQQSDERGYVAFNAYYFYQNLYCELDEKSDFIKEDGEWRYLEGIINPVADIKVARNDPCPCASGKKYKKCHSV